MRLRRAMNAAASLEGITGSFDLVVPVDLRRCEGMLAGGAGAASALKEDDGECPLLNPGSVRTNMFTASGNAALALDSAFTPVRLSESHECGGVSVAGSGVGGGDAEVNAKRMATSDLAAVLKPTNRHIVAELDAGFLLGSELAGIVGSGMHGRESDSRMRSTAGSASGTAGPTPITSMLSSLHCADSIAGGSKVHKVFSVCTSVR